MRRLLALALITAGLAGMAAAPATATVGPAMLTARSPTATGSNTAAVAGLAAGTANLTGPRLQFAGALSFSCPDWSLTVTRVTTDTLQVDSSLGPGHTCNFVFGTSFTVDIGCPWTLTFQTASFSTTTTTTTGATLDLPCAMTMTVNTPCTIVFPAQRRPGVTVQNITNSGLTDTSTNPFGARIDVNLSGLTYSTIGDFNACFTLGAEATNGAFIASAYVRNVWGML